MRNAALTHLLFPAARIKSKEGKRRTYRDASLNTKDTPAVRIGSRNVVLEHAVTGGGNGDPSGIPIRKLPSMKRDTISY